jgi:DNA-binding NarL/FixJ family response regulator
LSGLRILSQADLFALAFAAEILYAGLRELFRERSTLHLVGEAGNGVEAISQAMALQPDVIVMDVSMPQLNGMEATREIHRALSAHPDHGTRPSRPPNRLDGDGFLFLF